MARGSDRLAVPTKSPNKAGRPAAEEMEGRSLAQGKAGGQNALRTQGRGSASSALDRVREAAKRDKGQRFTALLHHVDAGRLDAAFRALKKDAAPGVDAVTWEQYSEAREANLHALQERLHQGGGTGRVPHGERTSRRRTGGDGRSASPYWRTR